MIRGSCHCGAVGFELAKTPEWLNDCNCSVCRRLGTLWAYGDASEIRLLAEPDATFAYVWGDRSLAFHICRTCGCTTHYQGLRHSRMAVNCRLSDPADIAGLRIRHFDGAVTWAYLD
jgi:hypothetical protein